MAVLSSVIPQGFKVPGVFIKVSLGVGQRAAGDSPRTVVVFGNKTSAGVGAVETEYDITSEDDAVAYAGNGSEAHLGCKAALTANPAVALKLMLVTESAGSFATGTLAFTGPATASGTVYIECTSGAQIEVPYDSGESAATIGARAVTYTNNVPSLPITAAGTTTMTATAKNRGPRGNHIALRARVTLGTGVGVTPPVSGFLTGGTTSDDPQTALDVQTAYRRGFLVAPYDDATQIAKFKTHVDAQEEPLAGNRKQVVFGSIADLASCTTLAVGVNFPRLQCVWMERADQTPLMMAASVAAVRALREATDPAYNFDGDIISGLKPHYAPGDVPNQTELNNALNNGITPLTSVGSGEVALVRSITCKSQQSGLPDFRVLDTHKVTTSDYMGDVAELAFADRYGGFKASDNYPEGEQPPPGVVTPAMCEDLMFEILNAAEGNGTAGMASGADDDAQAEPDFAPVVVKGGLLNAGSVRLLRKSVRAELSKIDVGRFNMTMPIDIIEGAHQFGTDVRQVG